MNGSFASLGARAPISLTPGGEFQLRGILHKTAILISPAGVFAWDAASIALGEADLLRFVDGATPSPGDFLLLGTGASLVFPSPAFRAGIEARGLGLETMDTGAASRTYNVLVGERRLFTAALLPLARGGASS